VKRRVDLLAAEGIEFVVNCELGVNMDFQDLVSKSDSIVLAMGATKPRGLPIPGSDLKGIHFAMEFLTSNIRAMMKNGLDSPGEHGFIDAKDKNVLVIGGGDTGCDCIGTSVRHGAKSITNFELMPQPPDSRADANPWPQWPNIFRVDYGHEEAAHKYGVDPREYSVLTKEFVGDDDGNVVGCKTVRLEWFTDAKGMRRFKEVPGSEQEFKTELVLLSMGFLGPEETVVRGMGLMADNRGNIKAPYGQYETNLKGVFAAGDCRRGQSLVVWAINEGRGVAAEVDKYLRSAKTSTLPNLIKF